jgi:nucleotide-binding universal stress UspA family protein
MPEPSLLEEGAEAIAQRVVDEVDVPDGVRVDVEVIHGPPSQSLIQRAGRADALVVGSRGHGGFVGLLTGSVATQCVNHATGPVIVVPAAPAR